MAHKKNDDAGQYSDDSDYEQSGVKMPGTRMSASSVLMGFGVMFALTLSVVGVIFGALALFGTTQAQYTYTRVDATTGEVGIYTCTFALPKTFDHTTETCGSATVGGTETLVFTFDENFVVGQLSLLLGPWLAGEPEMCNMFDLMLQGIGHASLVQLDCPEPLVLRTDDGTFSAPDVPDPTSSNVTIDAIDAIFNHVRSIAEAGFNGTEYIVSGPSSPGAAALCEAFPRTVNNSCIILETWSVFTYGNDFSVYEDAACTSTYRVTGTPCNLGGEDGETGLCCGAPLTQGCIDIRTDLAHCGACDTVCAGDCVAGVCSV